MIDDSLFKLLFGCSKGAFSENLIVSPFISPDRFKDRCEVSLAFRGRLYSGFTGSMKDKELTVMRVGMGPGPAGDAVLSLQGTAVKKMIFAGTCGGLKGFDKGDYVVAKSAFNGEGFSRYHWGSFPVDKVLEEGGISFPDADLTEDLARKHGLKKGNVFTIGSILAEDETNLSKLQEEGFNGIDMELSAVFSAARAAGIKSAGILLVSDKPLEEGISLEDADAKKINKLVDMAVEFMIGR